MEMQHDTKKHTCKERERERIICTGVPIGIPFLSIVEQSKLCIKLQCIKHRKEKKKVIIFFRIIIRISFSSVSKTKCYNG